MRGGARFTCALGFALACPGAAGQEVTGRPFPPEQIKKGAGVYEIYCSTCHGLRLSHPDWAVDLRNFPRSERARFVDTVTHGVRSMPPWGDLLKPDEIEALWAYVMAGEPRK